MSDLSPKKILESFDENWRNGGSTILFRDLLTFDKRKIYLQIGVNLYFSIIDRYLKDLVDLYFEEKLTLIISSSTLILSMYFLVWSSPELHLLKLRHNQRLKNQQTVLEVLQGCPIMQFRQLWASPYIPRFGQI